MANRAIPKKQYPKVDKSFFSQLSILEKIAGIVFCPIFVLLAIFAFPVFLVIFGFLMGAGLLLYIFDLILDYYSPEKRNERERVQSRNEELQLEKKDEQKLEAEQFKQTELAKYVQLRKQIEKMPAYADWRQRVFEKFGNKCFLCEDTRNLEVDHRFLSFYAILKKYKVTNVVQAYECLELWNVYNGAPLCKAHHDQTKTSIYRASKI